MCLVMFHTPPNWGNFFEEPIWQCHLVINISITHHTVVPVIGSGRGVRCSCSHREVFGRSCRGKCGRVLGGGCDWNSIIVIHIAQIIQNFNWKKYPWSRVFSQHRWQIATKSRDHRRNERRDLPAAEACLMANGVVARTDADGACSLRMGTLKWKCSFNNRNDSTPIKYEGMKLSPRWANDKNSNVFHKVD